MPQQATVVTDSQPHRHYNAEWTVYYLHTCFSCQLAGHLFRIKGKTICMSGTLLDIRGILR